MSAGSDSLNISHSYSGETAFFFLRSCGCQTRSTGSKKGELMEMLKCRKASFLTTNMMRGLPFVVFHLLLKAKRIRLCSQQGLKGESEWPCLQQISELAGEKHFATLVSHFQGYSATTQQEKVTCAASSVANALNSNYKRNTTETRLLFSSGIKLQSNTEFRCVTHVPLIQIESQSDIQVYAISDRICLSPSPHAAINCS